MWQDPLFLLVVISILVVVVILMIGLGGFTKGGDFNRKYANKLMRYRIIAQAFAVVMILIFIFVRRMGGS